MIEMLAVGHKTIKAAYTIGRVSMKYRPNMPNCLLRISHNSVCNMSNCVSQQNGTSYLVNEIQLLMIPIIMM